MSRNGGSNPLKPVKIKRKGVVKMFILTDGKHYVMENPMKQGEYLSSTSPVHAKEFSFKQARRLQQNKKKSLAWVRSYYMVNKESGETVENVPYYSNAGVFCGDNEYEFDDNIIQKVKEEIDSILDLQAWDVTQLNACLSELKQGQQYYDSAISDLIHARMGKRPPAHLRTKYDGLLNELEEKRRDIKQSILYIESLLEATKGSWGLNRVKSELSKVKYVPYKGRTKYFDMVADMFKNY